ncbi:zinc-dependent alcohol dehydrogenase [Acrocarpospora catenulata]|uniref:zinc-dependent alcohol dehydrogenase n=1 Tax=Acrocarpospora catenulata TaxID=2836182 RepID=UPI001BDA7629|nr:zinc-binding dehydrogenase [Acrocarpospora catenulata]
MWAYEMAGAGVLSLTERPDPACPPDGLLLRTEAVSVCSTDVSYYRGHLVPEQWPIVPGHEYVGRVVQIGENLRGRVREGDAVAYWGQTDFEGLAEYRAILPLFPGDERSESTWYTERGFVDAHQAAAVILPPDSTLSRMTLIEPLTSVLRAVLSHPPHPGDIVVVLGAGPIGLLAAQVMTRFFGVAGVMVLERNPARRAAALRLGVSTAFDPESQAEVLSGLADKHYGAVADYVFDTLPHVGASDVRAAGMRLLRADGTYVIFGATSIPQSVDTWAVLAKGLQLKAAPFDVRAFPMARTAHVMQVAQNLLLSDILEMDSLITGTVDFLDEAGVRGVFHGYGTAGGLKTVVVFGQETPGAAS